MKPFGGSERLLSSGLDAGVRPRLYTCRHGTVWDFLFTLSAKRTGMDPCFIKDFTMLIAHSSCVTRAGQSQHRAVLRPSTYSPKLCNFGGNSQVLFSFECFSRVGSGHQDVNRRHHKKRECSADDHSADQHNSDAVSRSGSWT